MTSAESETPEPAAEPGQGAPDDDARWIRRATIVGVVIFAALVAGVYYLTRPDPSDDFVYRTSSAYSGYKRKGTLADEVDGLVFHTNLEDDPWVEIDLLETQRISRVDITNRFDCCQERGLPLVVEVAGEDKEFVEVGRTETKFQIWDVKFPKRDARYVRIRALGKNILHLADVRIE